MTPTIIAALLALAIVHINADPLPSASGRGTFTWAGAGSGQPPPGFGILTPGGMFRPGGQLPSPGFEYGLLTCKREDADGNVLEESKCPRESTCSNPDGGVKIKIGDVVNRIYFCNNKYPIPSQSCKALDAGGKVIQSKNCTQGSQCAGGPVNGKDISGNPITYFVCVKQPTAEPKPDYAEVLLERLCCGGKTFNFHIGGPHSESSAEGGEIDTNPGSSGGGSSGGRRQGKGRSGKGGGRRGGGRKSKSRRRQ